MTADERAAVDVLLEHVQEYIFEDNPSEHSTCPSCGWDSATDGRGVVGLHHKLDCKLRAAIDKLQADLPAQGNGLSL